MELYISDHPLDLPHLFGEWRLRIAGYGGRRSACAKCATATGWRHSTSQRREGRVATLTSAFDSSKCIVCSRCVRACEDVQGTFALTIAGRGLRFHRVPRRRRFSCLGVRFLRRLRTGVSDGDAQREKSVIAVGNVPDAIHRDDLRLLRRRLLLQVPRRRASASCAWFPTKDGKAANEGHSCVKGRFAWGYATHKDRITEADDPRSGSPIRGGS